MHQMLEVKTYLKNIGFCMDKTLSQRRRLLLKSLSAEDRARLQFTLEMQKNGLSNGLDQYCIPKTAQQAALLFSYDWPRTVISFDWFARKLTSTGAGASSTWDPDLDFF
jgi:hypothetical protein